MHIIFATLGLSILLAKSAIAFEIVKWLGAIHLISLSVKTLLKRSTNDFELERTKMNSRKIYIAGIITNILNPKVALFFIAFLPQFINPGFTQSSLPF